MSLERLQKLIARAGVASRREAEAATLDEPALIARARKQNFTTSLRKSLGLAMPAGFSTLVNS